MRDSTLEDNHALPPDKGHPLRHEVSRTQNIRNTLLYVTIEATIFGLDDSDEFTVRVTEPLKEACELVEASFEYVTDMDGKKISANENDVSIVKNYSTFGLHSHRIFYLFLRLT